MPTFQSSNPDDKYIYELMPILIGIGPNGTFRAYGSCFIAGPHMAITARHVIEELYKQDPGISSGQQMYEYWLVQVIRVGADDPTYVVWTFNWFAVSAHSDIAVMWLQAWDENASKYKQWKSVPITFDPPPVGATVRAFGLHNVHFQGSRTNKEGKAEHIAVQLDHSVSTGTVRHIYWRGRDQAMYPFPCFEIDAQIEHGMSGGLVITEDSKVCGIVCGSLPATSPDESHISYVTMLWPMMAISVGSHLVPGGIDGARYRLQDLSAKGIFRPTGWDRVVIRDELCVNNQPTIEFFKKQN